MVFLFISISKYGPLVSKVKLFLFFFFFFPQLYSALNYLLWEGLQHEIQNLNVHLMAVKTEFTSTALNKLPIFYLAACWLGKFYEIQDFLSEGFYMKVTQ